MCVLGLEGSKKNGAPPEDNFWNSPRLTKFESCRISLNVVLWLKATVADNGHAITCEPDSQHSFVCLCPYSVVAQWPKGTRHDM